MGRGVFGVACAHLSEDGAAHAVGRAGVVNAAQEDVGLPRACQPGCAVMAGLYVGEELLPLPGSGFVVYVSRYELPVPAATQLIGSSELVIQVGRAQAVGRVRDPAVHLNK